MPKLIVEDYEAIEGFSDGESQQQRDLFQGTDGQGLEFAFAASRLDSGGLELRADGNLAISAPGQRGHTLADGLYQGVAEMYRIFLFGLHEGFVQKPPRSVLQVELAFTFCQSAKGLTRLFGPFQYVLAAHLFERTFGVSELHLELPEAIGGSGGGTLDILKLCRIDVVDRNR